MQPLQTIVVIPVFNRPQAIRDALASLLHQTFPPAELLIVDDGSTDDSPAAVTRWLTECSPCFAARLIRQPNAGPAAARNQGVDAAGKADLVAFLDSDDLWPADHLARMQKIFAADETVVAASCDMLDSRDGGLTGRLRRADQFDGSITTRLVLGDPPLLSATVFRLTAFHQTGGFDEKLFFAEDLHLMLRLSLLGPWRYAAGNAVTRRLECGEQVVPQSRRYRERAAIRARMLERFLQEEGGSQALPADRWRPHLAHLWYQAGRKLRRADKDLRPRDCYRRALALNPRHLRARLAVFTGP